MNIVHLATMFLAVAGALLLMMYAGVGKHALERKRRDRPCPACGRPSSNCRCRRG